MSAARFDHVAQALSLDSAADQHLVTEEFAFADMALKSAQVHATLALVEQQRIANLIALTRLSDDEMRIEAEDSLFEPDPTLGHGKPWSVRPGIREALGLS